MRRLFAVIALLPNAAFAHPGDHWHTGFLGNIGHVLTEPDHLAMLGVTGALVVLVAYLRKGRS